MEIAIAGNGAGVLLVDVLAPCLASCKGIEASGLGRSPNGTFEYYASVAERVAVAVLNKEFDRGILCGGTGIGMAISANKVSGTRRRRCFFRSLRENCGSSAQQLVAGFPKV